MDFGKPRYFKTLPLPPHPDSTSQVVVNYNCKSGCGRTMCVSSTATAAEFCCAACKESEGTKHGAMCDRLWPDELTREVSVDQVEQINEWWWVLREGSELVQ